MGMKKHLILFLVLVGLPILGAIIATIVGLVMNAPGCFLLTMGFSLMGAFTTCLCFKLIPAFFANKN